MSLSRDRGLVASLSSAAMQFVGEREWLMRLLITDQRVLLVKNVVAFVVAARLSYRVLRLLWDRGVFGAFVEAKKYVVPRFFKAVRRIPFVRAMIDKELGKVLKQISGEVVGHMDPSLARRTTLPEKALTEAEVKAELDAIANMGRVDPLSGRISGCVYHGGEELNRVINYAYSKFTLTNPLHPDVFPSTRKMEAEVVAICVRLFNGGPNACGTTTSGGTESILMACKAHRDWALDVKGITEPEMIIPVSAHAAFDKAASYFGIKLLHAPVEEKSRKVDLRAVRRMITSNTILIVGSAPGFAHGIIDDIEGLAKLALRWGIGLHVDCCLGSFLVPFMEKIGEPIPLVDFRVKGVTSISCDTHKYGFAPKGSSVVMYASHELRHYQYFVQSDWPGGIYASPSIAGSRPGALIAGCWATMMRMGEDGYLDSARRIIGSARRITAIVQSTPGLFVYGEPKMSVVAIGSNDINILVLGGQMTKRGWNLNSLQFPTSIHIACTFLTEKVVDQFEKDLREIAGEMMKNPDAKKADMSLLDIAKTVMGSGDKKKVETSAFYGMAAAIPDRSMVENIAHGYVDAMFIA